MTENEWIEYQADLARVQSREGERLRIAEDVKQAVAARQRRDGEVSKQIGQLTASVRQLQNDLNVSGGVSESQQSSRESSQESSRSRDPGSISAQVQAEEAEELNSRTVEGIKQFLAEDIAARRKRDDQVRKQIGLLKILVTRLQNGLTAPREVGQSQRKHRDRSGTRVSGPASVSVQGKQSKVAELRQCLDKELSARRHREMEVSQQIDNLFKILGTLQNPLTARKTGQDQGSRQKSGTEVP